MRKILLPALACLVLLSSFLFAEDSPEVLREAGHWKRLRTMMGSRAANPQDAEAAYYLSCVRMAFGDLEGAQQLAERAVALSPGNSSYHLQLGIVLGRKAQQASFFKAMSLGGRYKAEVRKAVDLDGKNIEAIWELMEFYWHAPGIAGGDQKKARARAEDIMRLNVTQGYLALAELGAKEEQIEDYYRKALESDPTSYEVQMRLARFYSSAPHRNLQLAEKYALQAIALDPGRIGGYKVMASIRAQQERWQELDSLLAQAASHVPDDLSPDFQAGLEILEAGKDPARAEHYFRSYLTQEPEGFQPRLSRAHWRIGEALSKQGKKSEAAAELKSALQMEPDLKQAEKELDALK